MGQAQGLKDSDPHEAAKLFVKSYRLDPKIDALAGYGAALAADKDFVGASEALEKAVEGYQVIAKKMQESDADVATVAALMHRIEFVQESLKQMGLKVAKVQLKGEQLPPNVKSVTRKGGDDLRPSTPMRFIVHPGGDVLIFSFTDGKAAEKFVNLSPGTLSTVDIPDEPKDVPAYVKPDDMKLDTGGDERKMAYVTGALGVVFLGAGIAYTAAAHDASAGLSGALLGVGGLGLGAAAVFYYWGTTKRDAAAKHTALLPVISAHAIGLVFGGTL